MGCFVCKIVALSPRVRQEEHASIRGVTGLFVAARYLTIVPIPGPTSTHPDALGRAAGWFPVIGLGVGVYLVIVEKITGVLFPSLLAGLLTVTAWKLVTGGLHLDGLADCLDGLGGRDAEHRLAIMRDSRIGAFGAIGLILFLLLEIGAVVELPPSVRARALLVVPVVARATPPLLALLFPAAKSEGFGAAFRASVSGRAAPIALALALLVAAMALRSLGVLVVAVSLLSAVAVARFVATRVAGITGDVLGAAIEVTELAGLLTVSAWSRLVA
ncbi:MAG: adenosylcobinamide-GDP ribazoletransferase [Candidatus Rokuibacteriota bacterium]|nr:MAG: adenosylcobinamide-GDP ribazoletransferase [Candidatus Rokubacteria bacterium]